MIASEQALDAPAKTPARNGVRLKTIALPVEHGGWGFLLEPMALGLLLAPSLPGGFLALSAVAFFLARQPLTLVALNRHRYSPRTAWARIFAALYVLIGISTFSAAVIFRDHSFILPLALAAPLAAVQLIYDWSGRKRVLFAELCGTAAISAMAAALALAGGWPRNASFALWAIMIARAVPAIFYVRGCLARLHRRAASPLPIWLAHAAALVLVALLARSGLAPRLAVAAMLILAVRAEIGFRSLQLTPKQLGFSEIGFGGLTVLAVVLGWSMGIG
ncbi:MAG TPA: YwiC-like family protein [Pyrinomonadaceae bacterium]|nr:YwiC-like family protein [Pyrinomonadaceae bacterium]